LALSSNLIRMIIKIVFLGFIVFWV
jgi:hypothetical protein